ncbi:MAG: glycosyltransferase [Treponema sp.]|nr:glycosyltransferase [Treponema sp.]
MDKTRNLITVLLLTYNSSWIKTKQTLLSIIEQENVLLEIIVSDDGSQENNFTNIQSFFSKHNFNNFKLVNNQKNQGTVKNILSGLQVASGEYVKPISPGDFFYSKDSLQKAVSFIQKDNNSASAYFGKSAYYSQCNNTVLLDEEKSNPIDIRPYLINDTQEIKRNYFIRLDTILGASVIYKRDSFVNHLSYLSEFVTFAEDYSLISLLANNETIKLLTDEKNDPFYFIWYESDTGISTQKQSKWHTILFNELNKTFKSLCDKKLISNGIYKANFSTSKIQRFYYHLTKDMVFYIKNKFKKASCIGWNNEKPDTLLITHLLEEQ